MKIGTLDVPTVDIRKAKMHSPCIGLNVLARYRFTMDFQDKAFLLFPPSGTDTQLPYPVEGKHEISLSRRTGHYYVSWIEPGSPAAKTGLRKMDRILSVDGHLLDGLPPGVASRLLDGFSDKKASVVFKRGNSDKMHVEFLRQNPFASSMSPK